METLRFLTPELTGSAAFPQAIDGVPDDDICEGRGYEEHLRKGIGHGSIQFELLGPVHYWVFGDFKGRGPHKLEFDRVV